jgi:CheY-like chemotaxis protein
MSETTRSDPLRVLVVDDCAEITVATATLVRCWGHDARVAQDGSAALELARAYQPQVVLLDIRLPDMDGYQVAQQLRKQTRGPQPLLISMTGYGQEQDRWRSRIAGCDEHWVKPVDLRALEGLLASRQRICQEDAAFAAEFRLHASPYTALKNVLCVYQKGVLTLRGNLPSFHLKQLAQETVAGLEGVDQVDNQIEVAEPAGRASGCI